MIQYIVDTIDILLVQVLLRLTTIYIIYIYITVQVYGNKQTKAAPSCNLAGVCCLFLKCKLTTSLNLVFHFETNAYIGLYWYIYLNIQFVLIRETELVYC